MKEEIGKVFIENGSFNVNKHKRPEQAKGIDFGRWVSEDDLHDIEDDLKGLIAIFSAMEAVAKTYDGGHIYNGESFGVLQVVLGKTIDKIEKLKPNLYYMDDICRFGVEYANNVSEDNETLNNY